jgi:hypothetical protein
MLLYSRYIDFFGRSGICQTLVIAFHDFRERGGGEEGRRGGGEEGRGEEGRGEEERGGEGRG